MLNYNLDSEVDNIIINAELKGIVKNLFLMLIINY